MSEIVDKPMRADARRNRAKVLAAARVVFAEQGQDAQIDDVARRADVGVGTVYRHFPTKGALLDALVDETFDYVAAYAREQLDRDDPWQAFLDVLWFAGEKGAGDRAFSEIMAARRDLPAQVCPGEVALSEVTTELMRRAQATGKMRPDAMIEDIPLLMCGVGSASGLPHPYPDAWRRHLAILLDGLQADAATGPLHSGE
jgi:AcrR family transcriptional regulator